jgi:hypothetical protein
VRVFSSLQAFLARVFNASAVQALAEAALPPLLSRGDDGLAASGASSRVTVVAAAHAVRAASEQSARP